MEFASLACLARILPEVSAVASAHLVTKEMVPGKAAKELAVLTVLAIEVYLAQNMEVDSVVVLAQLV